MKATANIWLFHAPEANDLYASAFRAAGYRPRSIPVLDVLFEPVDLSDAGTTDAIVVTSRRAVEAIRQTGRPVPHRASWYAVGPATARSLRGLGVSVAGEPPGTGAELAKLLIQRGVQQVLYVAGEPHRDELPGLLEAEGVSVLIRTAYRTTPRPPLELVGLARPDWAVFFSPRGVAAALAVSGIDWSTIPAAAIGATTADAMRSEGWPALAVAEHPTPESLVLAVASASEIANPHHP